MKNSIVSIFNLIEIFRSSKNKSNVIAINADHCDTDRIHDYYCDQEHLGI